MNLLLTLAMLVGQGSEATFIYCDGTPMLVRFRHDTTRYRGVEVIACRKGLRIIRPSPRWFTTVNMRTLEWRHIRRLVPPGCDGGL